MVCRVGSRLPLRRARPRRPCVREVPADPALPRVVPAPERRARRLRVVVRRREPSGSGVGRARGVRDRRRPGRGVPEPDLRQAARELHLVGEPPGRRRLEHLRGRLPRARQHRPDRPLPPRARPVPRAVRRHRVDGFLRAQHGRDRLDPHPPRAPRHRPRPEVPRALRPDLRRPRVAGALGTRADGFFTYDQLRLADGRIGGDQGCARIVGVLPLPRRRRRRRGGRRAGRDREQEGLRHASPRAPCRRAGGGAEAAPGRGGNAAGTARLREASLHDESEFLSPYGSARRVALAREASCSSSTSTASPRRSTTSPPSRRPASSAATRTGAARSGCP